MKIFPIYLLIILLLVNYACIDPYNPPEIAAEQDFLVVDGAFFPNQVSEVILTTTQNLSEEDEPSRITGASVSLQVKDGNTFTYDQLDNGIYRLMPVEVAINSEVRLRILNQGSEYISEYVPVLSTPEIDSISFKAENDGLQFFVNASDPQNNTWYYRWQFTETWEFNTAFFSSFEYLNGEVLIRNEGIYVCWDSTYSKNIYVGTSSSLSEDVISLFPLHKVLPTSIKLRRKYSLLVKQFALNQDSYQYYKELEANTENLGTLFDPLPFQLNGNFTNVDNPEIPVIGYFYSSEVKEKRIFVTSKDHDYRIQPNFSACEMDTVLLGELDEATDNLLLLTEYYSDFSPNLLGYFAAPPYCVDCRLYGSNVEPDYWQ